MYRSVVNLSSVPFGATSDPRQPGMTQSNRSETRRAAVSDSLSTQN
jgi:hypothetical protein